MSGRTRVGGPKARFVRAPARPRSRYSWLSRSRVERQPMRALSRLLMLVTAVTLGSTCSKNGAAVGDAAIDVPTSSDLGSTSDVGQASEVPADALLTPPAGVTFPDTASMSCAGGAEDCQFPPSACADLGCDGGQCPGLQWVVYYDNPRCVSGQCVFTKRYFQCGPGTACSVGGCRFNGTA